VWAFVEAQFWVARLLNVWAINHGNYVQVAIKAELKPDMTVLSATKKVGP
jgi:hypothetical protein